MGIHLSYEVLLCVNESHRTWVLNAGPSIFSWFRSLIWPNNLLLPYNNDARTTNGCDSVVSTWHVTFERLHPPESGAMPSKRLELC